MVKTRGIEYTKKKWKSRVDVAGPDYEAGVKDPKADWGTETKAAESRYEEGVKAAIGKKLFGKGVDEAGTAKWQKKTVEKGVRRWPEGVAVAEPDYEKGMKPVLDTIAGVTLPPRYPAGDPRNLKRVEAITTAVHEKLKGK